MLVAVVVTYRYHRWVGLEQIDSPLWKLTQQLPCDTRKASSPEEGFQAGFSSGPLGPMSEVLSVFSNCEAPFRLERGITQEQQQ